MSPFATQASPYPQQQQQQQQQHLQQQPPLQNSSFLPYSMPMEPPIRSFPPPPQQPIPGRYWQSPTPMEPSTSSFGKQARQGGGLDLDEFGDILETRNTNELAASAGGTPSEASEMSMASFEVNSFHDGMGTSAGDAGAFHAGVASMQTRPLTEPNAVAAFASSKAAAKSTSLLPASADPVTRALVDAAYTPHNDSPDEPDLSTEKLAKDKKEKCEFPACPNRARVSQTYGKFCNRHVIVAPCGFPGCREKAVERVSMCEKHMDLGKEALQVILDARSQNVPVCRMTGCFKNDQGRGYCRGHEKLLMATGRLPAHVNKRRLNSAYTMCSYPECNKHSQRHHLCRTHGNLIMKQAQELADRPGATESYEEILSRMQKEIRRCTHENCTRNSQRDRLCTTHYYEKHNLQKDGSAAGAADTNENIGSNQLGIEAGGGCDVRAVERTRCVRPGCGNLAYASGLCVEHTKENQELLQSQGRYGELFTSGRASEVLAGSMANEGRQAPYVPLNSKVQSTGGLFPAGMITTMNAASSSCSNPMCDRESYGRDYCEACQRLFSPLVVSVGEMSAGSAGYPFNSASSGVAQVEEKVSLCRVTRCGQESSRGGLCLSHLRAFQKGSLSVDHLKLESQARQREQELADAAAAAAAAAETKQASPSASGKARKYYCKVEGCGKQAQKQHLCKRHFRQEQSESAAKAPQQVRASGSSSSYLPDAQQAHFSQPAAACRFPECTQFASGGCPLCLTHSKATFCWQPGCEHLVVRPQFCDFHGFRKQCAYEGCLYSAERDGSGCLNHRMARRCRHEFCDKFAVGSDSDWCRLHQISCRDSPCALCRLHALSLDAGHDENSNRGRYNANLTASTSRGMSGGGFGGGNLFDRNPRLM
jgi:hypothetical protein